MQNEVPIKVVKPASESLLSPVVISAPSPRASGSLGPQYLRISKKRLAFAFVIAGTSDVISAFVNLAPPLEWPVDFVTALLLFVALGWHWLMLPALILEAIPGVGALPFWVMVVMSIAIWGMDKHQTERVGR
jgi:hypothetical protein